MNSLNIKTGDKVQVISGADKGKQGKIVTVSAKENKVIVEGVNMVTKHVKPKQAGQLGGRVQAERSTRPRFSSFAPSATSLQESLTRLRMARRSEFASTAAQSSSTDIA